MHAHCLKSELNKKTAAVAAKAIALPLVWMETSLRVGGDFPPAFLPNSAILDVLEVCDLLVHSFLLLFPPVDVDALVLTEHARCQAGET